jgi:decaprenyl-phosphate phosphoribosyltransferase
LFLGIVKLMRPKHWVKNLFVIAPLLFSGRYNESDSIIRTMVAFAAFCLIASATYVFNDIQDLAADRLHPVKSKSRPIAAGSVPVRVAWVLFGILSLGAGALTLNYPRIAFVIFAYLLLNVAYSLKLKRLPVIDMFVIAVGFVLRVYAGAYAIEVPVSKWMFVTTFCLALFLASMKRFQELKVHGVATRAVLGKYDVAFVQRVAEMSGILAVVFYSIFTITSRPGFVISIPIVVFVLVRYWFIADKNGAGESPTDLILKDWQILVAAIALSASLAFVMIAHYAG